MHIHSWPAYQIIDISQPITPETAHFPGDVPFQQHTTLTLEASQILNLSAFTMSPHIGSHADAPLHIDGSFEDDNTQRAGQLSLSPYLGPAQVVHLKPVTQKALLPEDLPSSFWNQDPFPERILIMTNPSIQANIFQDHYAHLNPALIDALHEKGVRLIGLDGPSVDAVDAKNLVAHHQLLQHKMSWLENLALSHVAEGDYILIALPLKFTQLDASPVRAILLQSP
jgi:arylformamidase